MKELKKLPMYYQNSTVSDVDKSNQNERSKRNLIKVSFYQTKSHNPLILYKPVSKIWLYEGE